MLTTCLASDLLIVCVLIIVLFAVNITGRVPITVQPASHVVPILIDSGGFYGVINGLLTFGPKHELYSHFKPTIHAALESGSQEKANLKIEGSNIKEKETSAVAEVFRLGALPRLPAARAGFHFFPLLGFLTCSIDQLTKCVTASRTGSYSEIPLDSDARTMIISAKLIPVLVAIS